MTIIKTGTYVLLMICLLIMVLNTKDVMSSKLFASLGIITAGILSNALSENSKIEE